MTIETCPRDSTLYRLRLTYVYVVVITQLIVEHNEQF